LDKDPDHQEQVFGLKEEKQAVGGKKMTPTLSCQALYVNNEQLY